MAFDERKDLILLHHAHFDERFAKPQAFLRTLCQGEIELLGRDECGANKLLTERGADWAYRGFSAGSALVGAAREQ
jgi:hypothetical protein